MKVYYNEFDKKKCAMLSQLMKDGHISKGDIDDDQSQTYKQAMTLKDTNATISSQGSDCGIMRLTSHDGRKICGFGQKLPLPAV